MPNYKAVDAVRLDAAMTATADAIREKTSGTDPIPWNAETGFAEAVAGITGGGAAVSVPMKDVNFYDYDGTRLYSYTVAEAAALTEMPPLPTQPGLICQGWNWNLADIKAMARTVNVGAIYITDDGKTRIYVTLRDGRTSPMLGCGINGTVIVDWGDGTTPDILTGTSASTVKWTPVHDYAAAGDYIITLDVSGTIYISGNSTEKQHSCLLRYSAGSDDRNLVYQSTIRKIEIGDADEIRFGVQAFGDCRALTAITISRKVIRMSNYSFGDCRSLRFAVMPDSVTDIYGNMFSNCYSLSSVAIPNSIKSIKNYALQNCFSLSDVVVPDALTSIGSFMLTNCYALSAFAIPFNATTIGDSAFGNCYSIASFEIPGGVTTIEDNAFQDCHGVRYYDFTRHTAVPTLSNANAFTGIPADCEIRVPAALADEWKAATNWSTYADYIVGV